ncbi:hypothetical protein BC939DRAFT_158920 [Gamsiella multidivaricata]|uniref:uncharacterized protein n=1 Tax=Gamsiella multidivaricata TaxID=101098 RepID=UPI00221E8E46|nr:uncharacterized protein BC939DRAFT_158920 [Gamsiella multidivaricata]KAI7823528.1 hypothetical protein BC939DRAFT_158920 [Gamsiella multidivaricata]
MRDRIRHFFQPDKSEVKNVKTQAARPERKIHHARASSIGARDDIDYMGSSIKVSSPEIGTDLTNVMTAARLHVFSENISLTPTSVAVPKLGARIDTTSQLAFCISLLSRNLALSPHSEGFEGASDQTKEAWQYMSTDSAHRVWVDAIEQNPVEQDHIRWLATRRIGEFAKATL